MTTVRKALKANILGSAFIAILILPSALTAAENEKRISVTPSSQSGQQGGDMYPYSFEELFLSPVVAKQLLDAFWNNGKKFAQLVKQRAADGNYWNTIVYDGLPPITGVAGYPKIFSPGDRLNVGQFAEYVNFVALNGDPRLAVAGKPNPIFPKIIIGVVVPRVVDGNDSFWRQRMAEAKKEAIAVEGKMGESHGACVWEIVRVTADDHEVIRVGGGGDGKKIDMPLRNAIIVTVPARRASGVVYDANELRIKLEGIFEDNLHVLTRNEYLAVLDARIKEAKERLEAIDRLEKLLEGKKNSDFK